MAVKVADPLLMREINKYHVLETIRRHGKISRVEISDRTFLSGTTVSTITSALINEGLVQAIHTEPTEGASRGRPRVFLELIPDAAYVFGILITLDGTTTTLTNFTGETMASVHVPVRVASWEPDVIVDLIEGSVRQIISESGVDPEKIEGIGIGIPGIVDPASGRSHSSPVFGARELPIRQYLEERMGMKVRIEKPSNLVALAESWFGLAKHDPNFAVITLGDTVSLSLMQGDDLQRGASSLGPTFAHIKVGSEGRRCVCGQLDCLHTYASTSALVKDYSDHAKNSSSFLKLSSSQAIEEICLDATAGSAAAKSLLDKQGKMLGVGVSHIVNIVNPAKIIVGVENSAHHEAIEISFRDSVERSSFSAHYESTEIVFARFDEKLWASGAAALMLADIYSAPWTA